MSARPAPRGFTLVEALVAMAVLGAVLASVYGMVSGQLRRMARGDEQVTLALFADNLLARLDVDLGGAAGSGEGSTADGIRWRVLRSIVQLPPPPDPGPSADLLGAEGEPGAEAASGGVGSSRYARDRGPGSGSSGGEGEEVARDGGGDAAGEAGAEGGGEERPPPVLARYDIEVLNARGQRFAVSTMRLEAAAP